MVPERLGFVVEYFDPQANLHRRYNLLFFPEDNSVEMYDVRAKRIFLKRCVYQQLALRDFFLGATITVFARTLKVVDFADEISRKHFPGHSERAIIVIGGEALYKVGGVLKVIMSSDARVHNVRLCDLAPSAMDALSCPFQRCYVMELVGGNMSSKSEDWCATFAGNVRVFVDPADIDAYRHVALEAQETTATLSRCAVCVVKPHAVNEHAGSVVQRILDEGFEITALGAFSMSRADAEDFLEVYAGVLPEHRGLVDDLASGPCWAMEVRAENSVPALRAVCGPHDPDICKQLFPNSIRAQLGQDPVRNAVHCTDLAEDGPLESEFFFKLLLSKG